MDHQKRDGVGWEEQEAMDRLAALSTQGHFQRGVRVLRLMGNTPVIAGLGASEVLLLVVVVAVSVYSLPVSACVCLPTYLYTCTSLVSYM